jgi:hypothetical protein
MKKLFIILAIPVILASTMLEIFNTPAQVSNPKLLIHNLDQNWRSMSGLLVAHHDLEIESDRWANLDIHEIADFIDESINNWIPLGHGYSSLADERLNILEDKIDTAVILTPERQNKEPQKYALLVGGGVTESDNFESFYKNIEYVFKTLKILGYNDKDIKVLFYGGKTPVHLIVEGNATKENFISVLNQFGNTIDSNDSLIIFRSGHGMIELVSEKYEEFLSNERSLGLEDIKWIGTEAVMKFSDGDLSHNEFQDILGRIKARQIIIILNQCFSGQFTDIAMNLNNTVVITETKETEFAINQTRRTLSWKHDEWPFVKCFFDGFLQNSATGRKQSLFDSFQHMMRCNPNIEGVPLQADRPLLKETPQIKYGRGLKKGTVYIY